MPKKKRRTQIPKNIEAEILYKNDHCCCMCHRGPKENARIQIHHINEDPSDYRLENLAVLCTECHDRLRDKLWMGRGFPQDEVRKYKKAWERAVAKKRKHLEFPPPTIRERIVEKVDEKGKIERHIEREISYLNGLAPKAFGINPHVSLSENKKLILEKAKRILKTKPTTKKLMPIFNALKKTPHLGTDDKIILSRVCLAIGDVKFDKKQYSKAEVFYKEALSYAKATKEVKIREICLYELGAAVGMQRRPKEALKYTCTAIELNPHNPLSWYNKGVVLDSLRKEKEAIPAYRKAIELGKKAKDWGKVASAYHNIGVALGYLEKYPQAVDSLQKAVQYCKKAKDLGTMASAYFNMGTALRRLDKYPQAVNSYQKAVQHGKKAKKFGTVANAYHNMGNALSNLEKYRQAVNSYQKAVEYGRKAKDRGTIVRVYYNMGIALRRLERYPQAVSAYQKAVHYGKKAKNLATVANAYYNMGYALGDLEKYPQAVNTYQKAVPVW